MTQDLHTTQTTIETEDRFQIPTYHKVPVAIVRGEGSYVWDSDGRKYLDFYGGHCVTVLGHCPPSVVEAIRRQAGELLFYSNVVYSPVRAAAAERLAGCAPKGLENVYFCNSGTEANETALKMARKHTGRSGVVALTGDFHGRTLGSLATTWNETYRAPYRDILPHTTFVDPDDEPALDEALGEADVAAVILEPIQSIAGVFEPSAEYLRAVRRATRERGVALIFDEVQTGIWRTGTFSISAHLGVVPDMITLAKSLGSGVPVGAVLASDEIAARVEPGDQGSTFGGGMLAMAAVNATLRTIQERDLAANAPKVFGLLHEYLADHVVRIRGRGCLVGLELAVPAAPVIRLLREEGVLVGGSAHSMTIRLMPSIATSADEVAEFAEALVRCLKRSGE